MPPITQISMIKLRKMTRAELPNPLQDSEPGFTTDTGEVFIGSPEVLSIKDRTEFPYSNTAILTEFSPNIEELLKYRFLDRDINRIATSRTFNDNGMPFVRNLQERLDDYVSVKAYGVKGDGSYNVIDMTTETMRLRIASIDAYSLGKTLFFPKGYYRINGPLLITKNSQWVGEPGTIIEVDDSNTDSVLETVDPSISIDSIYSGDISPYIRYGITDPLYNIKINNIIFKHRRSSNIIRLFRVNDVDINNCMFITPWSSSNKLTQSLYDSSSDSIGLIIDGLGTVAQPSNININSCIFDGNTYGISVTDQITKISISNSKFYRNFNSVSIGTPLSSNNGYHTASSIGPRGVSVIQSLFTDIASHAFIVNKTIGGCWSSYNSYIGCGRGLDTQGVPGTFEIASPVYFGTDSTFSGSIGDNFDNRNYNPANPDTHYIVNNSLNNQIITSYPIN